MDNLIDFTHKTGDTKVDQSFENLVDQLNRTVESLQNKIVTLENSIVQPGLVFVDSFETSVPAQNVDFGVNGNCKFKTPLNGDEDCTYLLDFYLPPPLSTASYALQFNLVGTDRVSARHFGGSTTGIDAVASLRVSSSLQTTRFTAGRITIHAKTGAPRIYVTHNLLAASVPSSAAVWHDAYAGFWDNDTDIIKAIRFHSGAADQVRPGARIVLWKQPY